MPNLWTYRIITDNGTAPNVSDGILTLTLCKPEIRKGAAVGDYVVAFVGAGSEFKTKAQKANNAATGFKFRVAYIFIIEEIVHMKEYKSWCQSHAGSKICKEPSFLGDCQYNEKLAWMPGPHGPAEESVKRNVGGKNALISRTYAAWTTPDALVLTHEQLTSMGIHDIGLLTRKAIGHLSWDLNADNKAFLNAILLAGPKPYGLVYNDGLKRFIVQDLPAAAAAAAEEEPAPAAAAPAGAAAPAAAGSGGKKGCCGKKSGGTRKLRRTRRKGY